MERLCTLTVKHGNLVAVDAPGAKASRKHIESRLEVIQGHFAITEKPTKDYVSLNNNMNFRLQSRKFRRKGLSISVFENPTVIRCPLSTEPLRILVKILHF